MRTELADRQRAASKAAAERKRHEEEAAAAQELARSQDHALANLRAEVAVLGRTRERLLAEVSSEKSLASAYRQQLALYTADAGVSPEELMKALAVVRAAAADGKPLGVGAVPGGGEGELLSTDEDALLGSLPPRQRRHVQGVLVANSELILQLAKSERLLSLAQGMHAALREELDAARVEHAQALGARGRQLDAKEGELASLRKELLLRPGGRAMVEQAERAALDAAGAPAGRGRLVARSAGYGLSSGASAISEGETSELDVREDENLLELHVSSAELSADYFPGGAVRTLVSADFFAHESVSSGMADGHCPAYNLLAQYITTPDDVLLHHLRTHDLTLELHQARAAEHVLVGRASVSLCGLLSPALHAGGQPGLVGGGSGGRLKMAVPILSADGLGHSLGSFSLSLRMRRPMDQALVSFFRRFPELTAPPAALEPRELAIRVLGCRDLRAPDGGSGSGLRPYVFYSFLQFGDYETPPSAGASPRFASAHAFVLDVRSRPLREALRRAPLRFSVLDDDEGAESRVDEPIGAREQRGAHTRARPAGEWSALLTAGASLRARRPALVPPRAAGHADVDLSALLEGGRLLPAEWTLRDARGTPPGLARTAARAPAAPRAALPFTQTARAFGWARAHRPPARTPPLVLGCAPAGNPAGTLLLSISLGPVPSAVLEPQLRADADEHAAATKIQSNLRGQLVRRSGPGAPAERGLCVQVGALELSAQLLADASVGSVWVEVDLLGLQRRADPPLVTRRLPKGDGRAPADFRFRAQLPVPVSSAAEDALREAVASAAEEDADVYFSLHAAQPSGGGERKLGSAALSLRDLLRQGSEQEQRRLALSAGCGFLSASLRGLHTLGLPQPAAAARAGAEGRSISSGGSISIEIASLSLEPWLLADGWEALGVDVELLDLDEATALSAPMRTIGDGTRPLTFDFAAQVRVEAGSVREKLLRQALASAEPQDSDVVFFVFGRKAGGQARAQVGEASLNLEALLAKGADARSVPLKVVSMDGRRALGSMLVSVAALPTLHRVKAIPPPPPPAGPKAAPAAGGSAAPIGADDGAIVVHVDSLLLEPRLADDATVENLAVEVECLDLDEGSALRTETLPKGDGSRPLRFGFRSDVKVEPGGAREQALRNVLRAPSAEQADVVFFVFASARGGSGRRELGEASVNLQAMLRARRDERDVSLSVLGGEDGKTKVGTISVSVFAAATLARVMR